MNHFARIASKGRVSPEEPGPKTDSVSRAKREIDFAEKETMPIYDESIFELDGVVRELGFTTDDIADISTFVRWHIEQREKQKKGQ